ncbi:MAG: transporter [Legionellales bacterium RIFCSPHIGHO2_12_FULL_35_11]|nr:MAG: transporter [Legionellales bacterium RIFCSPHIGHO2_12_FULL_35_11]
MKSVSLPKISVIALVLLITGAIDSVRNLPATALFGSSLVFFFLFSAIIFLIPVALVSAELSATFAKEEGGIYSWVKNAYGSNLAFFTIWLQWINTMAWYPTILSFIAGTIAYLINPDLAQHKFYLIAVILTVFWSLTILGLSGLKSSAKFAGFCAIIGMILPIGLIIILAMIWIAKGNPSAIHIHLSDLIPNWHEKQSWVSLTAIMTSFLGMELAAVHVRNVKRPQRNFPKAMLFSTILILLTMILGSLSIAIVLPRSEIGLVQGVMQAFANFLNAYHLASLMPVLVIMLLLGSLGSMINWIISPAKGLLVAANHGFLPAWLCKLNRHNVASRIIILQAVLVTILCGGLLLLPSVNAFYWLFTALSTELYIIMYVMMFISAIKLKSKFANRPRPFAVPGGKLGYYFTCCLGLFGCIVTLIIGFFPPQEAVGIGGENHFRIIFGLGIITMLIPAFLLYFRKTKKYPI